MVYDFKASIGLQTGRRRGGPRTPARSQGEGTQEPQLVHWEGGPRTPGAVEQDVAWASSAPRSTTVVECRLSVASPRPGAWAAPKCKGAGDVLLLGAPEPDRGLKSGKPSVPAAGREPKKPSQPASKVVRDPVQEREGCPRTPVRQKEGPRTPACSVEKGEGTQGPPGPSQTLVVRRGGAPWHTLGWRDGLLRRGHRLMKSLATSSTPVRRHWQLRVVAATAGMRAGFSAWRVGGALLPIVRDCSIARAKV